MVTDHAKVGPISGEFDDGTGHLVAPKRTTRCVYYNHRLVEVEEGVLERLGISDGAHICVHQFDTITLWNMRTRLWQGEANANRLREAIAWLETHGPYGLGTPDHIDVQCPFCKALTVWADNKSQD